MCEAEPTSLPNPASRPRAQRRPHGWLRSQRTILLIEDDEEMRKLLQRVLTREGYEVVALADGDQALLLITGAVREAWSARPVRSWRRRLPWRTRKLT